MKRVNITLILLLACILVLASCRTRAPETPSGVEADAVYTAAALTAEARNKEATETYQTPTPDSTSGASLFVTPTSLTGTEPAPTTGSASTGEHKAEFVEDISIPDGTEIPPLQPFTKTWRLKNAGTATWTTDYNLVFVGGDRMGAQKTIPLPHTVTPDQTVDLSVEFAAPSTPGTYTSFWNLQTPAGDNFGVGVGGVEAFWVEVVVSESAAPIVTPTLPASANVVTSVFLIIDSATAEVCPHTYNFIGQITLSSPATVSYQLEAGSTDPGFNITLPDPVTANLSAGTTSIEYTLTFTSSINGWAQLHVTAPGDHISNRVNFLLTCD